jgi:hypothetical protein
MKITRKTRTIIDIVINLTIYTCFMIVLYSFLLEDFVWNHFIFLFTFIVIMWYQHRFYVRTGK